MVHMSTTVEIVKTPDVLHGNPRLQGTRFGVFMLGESVRRSDRTPADLREDHPDLSREQIELALDYYDDHPELMDTLRTQREAYKQRVQAQSRAPNQ
jgi:uncharacterized protein (DUF433 family)